MRICVRAGAGRMARVGAALICVLLVCRAVVAVPLDVDVQRKVQQATFEVVVPKPAKESATFDKPWENLIPYKVRSDHYLPVGTAFSIGHGRYVTAMHVLFAVFGDTRGEPLLRDAGGNVYPIGQIVKGSADKDFVVFTLAKAPSTAAAFDIEEKPQLNETVYAVGNALGEGIVVREGNYTSDTPEDENGRWQWLRFSAPISGGNSGGPLLDDKGRVIGIVRAKRVSENTLNFAVPIALVTGAADGVVQVDSRVVTGVAVFEKTRTAQFKADIPMPKSFAEFSAAYMKSVDDFNARQLHDLLAENAGETFPHGSGSEKLLRALYQRNLPGVIVQNGSGTWTIDAPRYARLDLGNEGWQDAASFKGELIYHRHKPEDIDQAKWYADPQLVKELVLKSSPSTIHVNAENAKVLSFGKPDEDSTFTDVWGRVWQVCIWHVTSWFTSNWLVEFDLPVPDGHVGFERNLGALGRSGQIERMKLLTGFLAVSYEGTLAQWNGFLAQKALLPKALAQPVLHVDYGRSFAFDGRRVTFSYGPELQKIDQGSRLRLDFGFIPDARGAVLDIAGVAAYDREEKTEVGVFRHGAPAQSAGEDAKNEWDKRLHHRHPYDAVAVSANDRQSISTIFGKPDPQPAPGVLYTFQYRAENGTAQDAMKAKLDLLLKNAKVDER